MINFISLCVRTYFGTATSCYLIEERDEFKFWFDISFLVIWFISEKHSSKALFVSLIHLFTSLTYYV